MDDYTYETAKVLFANHARIFNLVDTIAPLDVDKAAKIKHMHDNARSDFWIFENDMSIGASASPVHVDYTEQKAPAVDYQSASPGKQNYIHKRAAKKGLQLVDYVESRRPIQSWARKWRYSPVNFSIHALKRYWERSQMGNGENTFRDIGNDTISFLSNYNWHEDSAGDKRLLRQFLPYEDGVWLSEGVMKPMVHLSEGSAIQTDSGMVGVPGVNMVTFLHRSQLTTYQLAMCKAIESRDKDQYKDLLSRYNNKTFSEDFRTNQSNWEKHGIKVREINTVDDLKNYWKKF